jgi:galacturan 1,4-alpha-galacturonidase
MHLPTSFFLLLLHITLTASSGVHISHVGARKECTVTPLGGKQDDVPNILKAFQNCDNGGTIIFPEKQEYWIGRKLSPVVKDVVIEWRGIWIVCLSFQPYR